jgi:hypothetical protein
MIDLDGIPVPNHVEPGVERDFADALQSADGPQGAEGRPKAPHCVDLVERRVGVKLALPFGRAHGQRAVRGKSLQVGLLEVELPGPVEPSCRSRKMGAKGQGLATGPLQGERVGLVIRAASRNDLGRQGEVLQPAPDGHIRIDPQARHLPHGIHRDREAAMGGNTVQICAQVLGVDVRVKGQDALATRSDSAAREDPMRVDERACRRSTRNDDIALQIDPVQGRIDRQPRSRKEAEESQRHLVP